MAKTPLRYQATEFDCGPTAFLNAAMFLLERKEMRPELLRIVNAVTLDRYFIGGDPARRGTSGEALRFLASWTNDAAAETGLPLRALYLSGDDLGLGCGRVLDCLREGGAVVLRCWLGEDHYVTITGLEGNLLKVFDPYYVAPGEPDWLAWAEPGSGIQVVDDAPFTHNRLVDAGKLAVDERAHYARPCETEPQAVLMWRA